MCSARAVVETDVSGTLPVMWGRQPMWMPGTSGGPEKVTRGDAGNRRQCLTPASAVVVSRGDVVTRRVASPRRARQPDLRLAVRRSWRIDNWDDHRGVPRPGSRLH
jgi:hypothetical protein